MDIMTPPNKETLEYFDIIEQWLKSQECTKSGIVHIFKADTPQSVIDRFEEIKTELPFYRKLASESSRIMSDKK